MITKKILNEVLAAYLECVLFTECGDEENGITQEHCTADFSPKTIKAARREILAFLYLFKDALARALAKQEGYGWAAVGHDIWLSRNGHGVGFDDRKLGGHYGYSIGYALTQACQMMGTQNAFYDGDIGFIILERG
jgi:hypothetical protein